MRRDSGGWHMDCAPELLECPACEECTPWHDCDPRPQFCEHCGQLFEKEKEESGG